MSDPTTPDKQQKLQSAFESKLDAWPPHVLDPLRASYREGIPHLAPEYRAELARVLKGFR